MGFLSFSKILTAIVFLYILYSFSSFYHIFYIDECREDQDCIFPVKHLGVYEIQIYGTSVNGRKLKTLMHLYDVNIKEAITKQVTFAIPQSISNNKSYAITIDVIPVYEGVPQYDNKVTSKMDLTKLRIPAAESFNLLNEKNLKKEKTLTSSSEMHIYNKIVINSLVEDIVFAYQNIPQEIAPLLKVSRSSDRRLVYKPIIFGNAFVLSDEDLLRVTTLTDKTVNITIEVMPISLGKLRLWRLIEHSTEDLARLGFNDKNVDSVRGIFTHTNFYLLIVTFSVAALHLLFDILSFKNDISFWRHAKSTEGLSGRTVLWRCISSVIIFFYLMEEDTSLLVLVPFGISTIIEFWKLTRVLKISLTLSGFKMQTRDTKEAATDKIDSEGMRYLMWLVVPLCVAGAIYSLLYLPHKSWYSWTVNTFANGVYVFGFLFMMPQLFINHRLKSVAHLPWKALTYKAFNTFIDDFFAFIITMPTSHRLACFRDDIVFVIYLYQKWLYPVDKSRVNEYGHSFENSEDNKKVQ